MAERPLTDAPLEVTVRHGQQAISSVEFTEQDAAEAERQTRELHELHARWRADEVGLSASGARSSRTGGPGRRGDAVGSVPGPDDVLAEIGAAALALDLGLLSRIRAAEKAGWRRPVVLRAAEGALEAVRRERAAQAAGTSRRPIT